MNSLSDNQVSIYEEPVQEKVRKFLKIEYLFDRIYCFKNKEDKRESYTALVALNELHEILSRSDIKSELIREVETHNTYFKKIKDSQSSNTDTASCATNCRHQRCYFKRNTNRFMVRTIIIHKKDCRLYIKRYQKVW